jgi:hypothetical protein
MLVSSAYISAAYEVLTESRYRGIGSAVVQRLPHPRQYIPLHPRHRLSHQPRTRILRRRSHRSRNIQNDLPADPDRCVSTRSSPEQARCSVADRVDLSYRTSADTPGLAGTKFVLLTTPSHPHPDQVLRKVYETYADHLKDPFYTAEMPIRSETFDVKMAAVVRGA